ncbi:MAG: cation:proton antiporter [Oscillospiraceae bacterium]|nr:cation:proton antiporter [Oscillospiraceae bacterium]MBQ3049039.1 cation:proton antiporter [Oscillospiraceae bacterium]MBQ9938339.1 cation:proton antiporter [Oscillospiraceae bacterium]
MPETTEVLLTLAIALLSGLLLSRLAKKVGLPAVTAYLVAGVVIGPFLLGKLGFGFNSDTNAPENYSILCDLALGFIAFAIGNEFRLAQLKKIGKQATVIGIFQAIFTTVVVDAALIALSFILPEGYLPLPAAIILGAVATATAPAATLMVVRQYKAKGPVTDILLPIVALDDAVGLVVFAISFGVAGAIDTGAIDAVSMIINPVLEVVLSIALGAVMGYLFTFCEKFFHSRSKRMAITVTFVMLTVAISSLKFEIGSIHIAFSSLLACMMLGTIFCNICDFSEELMDRADRWTAPLLVLFFVISGAELDLSVFSNWIYIVIGGAYIAFRSLGKYYGARISSKISGCDENIVKYLGITLLPQAGVALGMASQALAFGGDVGTLVQSITLFSVLIYELVGPFLTKVALTKAGDIRAEGKTSARDAAKQQLQQN